jgi:predicted outer membrane repeat protein
MYVSGSGGEQGDTTSGMYVHVGANSTFSNNTADRNGGAIHIARAQLSVQRTRLSHNAVNVTAQTPMTSASGGGMYCDECVVTIRGSAFDNNTAALGGGAAVLRAESANITSTDFNANTANATAGASPAESSVTSLSSRSSEQGFSYLGGGGLYLETDECNLANLTFAQNTAPVAGEPKHSPVLARRVQNTGTTTPYTNSGFLPCWCCPKLGGVHSYRATLQDVVHIRFWTW